MGAIQGLIEFVVGLVLIAMVFVLLQPLFDFIRNLCLGMGGFAASAYIFCASVSNTAIWTIVFVLGLNALLHSMGFGSSR